MRRSSGIKSAQVELELLLEEGGNAVTTGVVIEYPPFRDLFGGENIFTVEPLSSGHVWNQLYCPL